jgi:hypothetical protein
VLDALGSETEIEVDGAVGLKERLLYLSVGGDVMGMS